MSDGGQAETDGVPSPKCFALFNRSYIALSDGRIEKVVEMAKLSAQQIADFAGRLGKWLTPADFDAILREVESLVGFHAVGDGRMKWWREGFVAMSCAQLSHARRLRLGDDPPDFHLDYGDHEREFELVDILPAGTKRTGDYDQYGKLADAGKPIPIPQRDWSEESHNAVLRDLQVQLDAKSAKQYPPGTILVADIQHNLIPIQDAPMEARLAKCASSYLDRFEEIWLRNGAHIIRVSPARVSRLMPLEPTEDSW